jgi:Cu/Ag efflux pump CusA
MAQRTMRALGELEERLMTIAGGEPGNELQAPMAVVILGGLVSSTALNMIVIPALYSRFARPRAD